MNNFLTVILAFNLFCVSLLDVSAAEVLIVEPANESGYAVVLDSEKAEGALEILNLIGKLKSEKVVLLVNDNLRIRVLPKMMGFLSKNGYQSKDIDIYMHSEERKWMIDHRTFKVLEYSDKH